MPELDLLSRSLVLGPLGLFWVIVTARVVGLRTFSKMTVFDFVATIAVGSMLAAIATATDWSSVVQASIGLTVILGTQAVLAKLRNNSDTFMKVLQNDPVLLVRDGQWIEAALKQTRVAKSDIWGKLREANVTDLDQVRAVILETTGDISVMHGTHLDEKILSGVSRADNPDSHTPMG